MLLILKRLAEGILVYLPPPFTVSNAFSAITGSAPSYLSDLSFLYTLSRTLRSSSDTRLLRVQRYKRKTPGQFPVFFFSFWSLQSGILSLVI